MTQKSLVEIVLGLFLSLSLLGCGEEGGEKDGQVLSFRFAIDRAGVDTLLPGDTLPPLIRVRLFGYASLEDDDGENYDLFEREYVSGALQQLDLGRLLPLPDSVVLAPLQSEKDSLIKVIPSSTRQLMIGIVMSQPGAEYQSLLGRFEYESYSLETDSGQNFSLIFFDRSCRIQGESPPKSGPSIKIDLNIPKAGFYGLSLEYDRERQVHNFRLVDLFKPVKFVVSPSRSPGPALKQGGSRPGSRKKFFRAQAGIFNHRESVWKNLVRKMKN